MFAAPTPVEAAPPAITAAQQVDLDCLSVGAVLGKSANGSGVSPWASRLVRAYLARLRNSDPDRDWLSMTVPTSAMTYGWFLGHMADCERPLRSVRRPRPPPEAAPD